MVRDVHAGPVGLRTWYEFSFFEVGILAQGCPPADPLGFDCIPSSGTPTVFADPPPWTFTAGSDVVLTVTDAFLHGDGFDVFDFGVLIGATTPLSPDDSEGCGPVSGAWFKRAEASPKNYFTYNTSGAAGRANPRRSTSAIVAEAVFDALGLSR